MKKGFTLIELLAVIIILAIIALIATPIVIDVIEDSKNSTRLSKLELYANSIKLKRMEKIFAGEKIKNNDLTTLSTEIGDNNISCTTVTYDDYMGPILYGCSLKGYGDNYCYKNGVVKRGEDECASFLDNIIPTIESTESNFVVEPDFDKDIRNYFITT